MGTISDILASCTSATLPILFQGSPESVLLASVLPPLLSKAFNAIGDDLLKKNLTQKEMKILGIEAPTRIYQAVGCPACNGTGYRGRLGIHEILEVDEEAEK